MKTRIEKDSMGEVEVPDNKYWGAQTQRSLENFKIGANLMPMNIIFAFAILKKTAAKVNSDLNLLSFEKEKLISEVCDEILRGELNDEFPLSVWQTGSGTHTNMNLNEVIANRSNFLGGYNIKNSDQFVSPNDDVNKSQSSNDTFSAAMHIAATKVLIEKTIPAVEAFEFMKIIKVGRTHMMDATPITLGQEFSGYVTQLEYGLNTLKNSLTRLFKLPIGGTAVGTGLNAPKEYSKLICLYISGLTELPFEPANNKFELIASHDALIESHNALKVLAISLMKIASDIRLLGSGPRSGLGELILPSNEPGSSIMPGKVNPTQCEALTMVCAQILGNDTAISIGGMSGQLELNAFKPMIIFNFINSAILLADVCHSFEKNCVSGIQANVKNIQIALENSLMLVTALNPHIGYNKAAEIAKVAYENNISLREAAINSGHVTSENYDLWVDPKKMV
jgi:fumarate hydratase class II